MQSCHAKNYLIDDKRLWQDVRDYVAAFNPDLADRVEYYDADKEGLSLFERHHVHEQVHQALDRKVWLPSGGSLIIEGTEALTVVDVNTGKNVGKSNLEETVFHNNMEAAVEVAKQLRLRDIGGIIVIDFVDMEIRENRGKVVEALRDAVPSISLEVGPMETDEYRPLVEAGAEGLVVYQETYHREVYAAMHTSGPKRNFDWRLETPERAHAAGFRRLGIGALFGLSDWRRETLCLAMHAQYLLRHCWKSQLTISLPRPRPCAGEFEPLTDFNDRNLVQAICALRLFLPDAGIVLSTREPASLRDRLIPLGITMMSAGSHTEPGGYTGAGQDNLHYTERGRIRELVGNATESATHATGQFDIADEREPSTVAATLTRLGYEPVWKDWDPAILSN